MNQTIGHKPLAAGLGKDRRCAALGAVLVLLSTTALVPAARAADVSWTGTTDLSWGTASNWSNGAGPGGMDTAVINLAGPVGLAGISATVDALSMGATASQSALEISGGGSLTSGFYDNVGDVANSKASVTVTGAGSAWTNTSGGINMGVSGAGALEVADGGAVSVALFNLGRLAGGEGAATIRGDDSTLASGGTTVGYSGSGSLTVSDGAEGTLGALQVGMATGGSGALRVETGGAITSGAAYIGNQAGAEGDATVTGAGSSWTATGQTHVGLYGKGALTFADGATGQFTGIDVAVSNGSEGALTVQSGAQLTATGLVSIGNGAGSSGSVNLTGANTKASFGGLSLGHDGKATLTVGDGAELAVGSLNAAGGSGGAAVADITVTGADSAITVAGGMWLGVGAGSTSSLTIEDSGRLSTSLGGLYLENGAEVKVTGAGSELQVGAYRPGTPDTWADADGWLSVGNASVSVTDGARVEADGIYVQGHPGGAAELVASGAGTELDGHLLIYVGGNGNGGAGDGALTLADGATATASVFAAGVDAGTTGHLLLTGADSRLDIVEHGAFLGNVYAGSYGDGTIVVQEGAALAAANELRIGYFDSKGALVIGAEADSAALGAGSVTASKGVVFGTGEGRIVFNHTSEDYTFGSAIRGEGRVEVLAGATTLSGENSYSGVTEISGGTLSGGAASFGTSAIVNNGTLVVSEAGAATFSNALSGTGTLVKRGAGVLTLGANQDFAGATTLAAGGLAVNGALQGSVVTAQAGTVLSGAGTVGGVIAETGATVAAGNSIGTLNVAGDYQQATGSTYAVEVTPGNDTADRIAVTGAANLEAGAVLNVSKVTQGTYSFGARYHVLSAAGGVTGRYTLAGDTALSAFYTLGATYDLQNVYLETVQTRAFAEAGVTRNQRAAAAGLQSLDDGSTLRQAVALLGTDAEAQRAFDALSGEIHATLRGAVVEDSRFARNAAVDRLRAAFGGSGIAADAPALAFAPGAAPDPAGLILAEDGPAVWSQAYGAWADVDGDGNAAKASHDAKGMVFGADALFGDWRLGVLGGYGQSDLRIAERAASAKVDSYTLGVYGGRQWGPLGLRVGAAFSRNDLSTQRDVDVGGPDQRLTGDGRSNTVQAFGDLGYRIETGAGALEPFAGLAQVTLRSNAFTETGGAAALGVESERTQVTFATLGLRGSRDLALGDARLTATGTLGLRHAWGDVTPEARLGFAGADAFDVGGLPVAENVGLVELGLSGAVAPNVTLNVSYAGQFGDGVTEHGLRGLLNYRF